MLFVKTKKEINYYSTTLDYLLVGINHYYAPFGLYIVENLSMLYTFWTIHWSK